MFVRLSSSGTVWGFQCKPFHFVNSVMVPGVCHSQGCHGYSLLLEFDLYNNNYYTDDIARLKSINLSKIVLLKVKVL